MSLIFISLLSVLVVGFLTSMRIEVSSADAGLQSVKAANLAQAATDMAVARLLYGAGTATPSLSIWASQPGQIMMATRSSTASAFSPFQTVDLYSGTENTTDTNIVADLNGGTNYLVTRAANRLPVRWIYLRKDGTLEVTVGTTVPAYNANNPLVGRFAFWVDDECARVNLNTAMYRSSVTNSWGSAAQVNLMAFGSTMSPTVIDALDQYRTATLSGHYLQTLRDARTISSVLRDLVDNERFSLTVNSQAPELNMFGEPRLVLTTQRRLAGNAPFLDILAADNGDPGRQRDLDQAKIQQVIGTLSQILCRTDWPIATGSSFAGKFSPVLPQQIAANIIEYVRAKESKEDLIEAIRGTPVGPTGFTANSSSGTLMGNARGLRFTEIAFFAKQDTTTTSQRFILTVRAEVHLPENTHISPVDLTTLSFGSYIATLPTCSYYDGGSAIWLRTIINSPTVSMTVSPPNTARVFGSPIIRPGEYRVIEATSNWFKLSGNAPLTSLNKIWPGFSIMRDDANARIAYSTVDSSISYTYSSAIAETDVWPSFAVDDPALSTGNANWAAAAGSVTFGAAPSTPINTLNTVPTLSGLQQDLKGGKLTNIGMQFPPAAFTSSNLMGVVESVAELGYIHTGMTSLNTIKGVPWRTLRLQPKTDNSTLPDWLLLDMFTVPTTHWTDKNKTAVAPTGFSYYMQPEVATSAVSANQRSGGVINVNAQIMPAFTSGAGTLTRTAPLKAAFLGVYTTADSTGTLSAADTVASNIAGRILAGNGFRYGFAATSPLISRGQIVEFAGVTDNQEESENLLRGAIDTLTARSSAFRIFAIGQSILQSSSGGITVQGEKRSETVVERVLDPLDGKIKFKTISSQTPKP